MRSKIRVLLSIVTVGVLGIAVAVWYLFFVPRLPCKSCLVFHGTGSAEALDVTCLPDGGVVLVGKIESKPLDTDTGSFWVLRLDADGRVRWDRRLGSLGSVAQAVTRCRDGALLVAGITDDVVRGEGTFVARLSPDGELLWEHTAANADWSAVNAVVETVDGGALATGVVAGQGEDPAQLLLLRLGPSGEPLWERRFGGSEWDEGRSLLALRDGGCVVTGTTTLPDTFTRVPWLMRLDADGQLPLERDDSGDEGAAAWERSASFLPGEAYGVLPAPGGGYTLLINIIQADLEDPLMPPAVPALLSLDALGRESARTRYPRGSWATAEAMAPCSDGGFLLVGDLLKVGERDMDIWLSRLDAEHVERWSHRVAGTRSDNGYGVCETPRGDVIAVGMTRSTGGLAALVVRLDADGAPAPFAVSRTE